MIALTGVCLEKILNMFFCVNFFYILAPCNSGDGRISSTVKTGNISPDLTLKDIFRNSINLKHGLSAQTEKIV
jgi:hypothetical protein